MDRHGRARSGGERTPGSCLPHAGTVLAGDRQRARSRAWCHRTIESSVVTAITSEFDDTELSCITSRAIAIDVGGSHMRCGLVGHQGILSVFDHPISPKSRLLPLLQVLEQPVAGFARNGDCRAIAISFPGIVTRDGKVLSTPRGKFEDAPDIDLAGWAKERVGLRLIMENDARMALLGECAAGAAQNCMDVVIVMLGTGVGSAVMIHGALLRGAHFQAGCLGGHIPARFDGRPCICGAIGCVEAEASTWALGAIARALHTASEGNLPLPSQLNFATVFRCSAAGDSFMTEVRDHCLNVWSAGIVGLIHAYDPSVVVLGGGVMASASQIIPPGNPYIAPHAFPSSGKPELPTAKLAPDAALFGPCPFLHQCLSASQTPPPIRSRPSGAMPCEAGRRSAPPCQGAPLAELSWNSIPALTKRRSSKH